MGPGAGRHPSAPQAETGAQRETAGDGGGGGGDGVGAKSDGCGWTEAEGRGRGAETGDGEEQRQAAGTGTEWEAREILRAQLMGGSARAVGRVAALYDKIFVDWMRRGEVWGKGGGQRGTGEARGTGEDSRGA